MTTNFEPLFRPGEIGSQTIRNRIVVPPMGTNFAGENGAVTDKLIEYYTERASGGAGLIIVEVASVDYPQSNAIARQLRIDEHAFVAGLAQLATRIHNHGARAFVQLHHAGGGTTRTKTRGVQPVVPSRVDGAYNARDPRVLDTEEIPDLVDAFVDAAARAQKAGFDGVEIHGAHGYLIEQFISPRTNKRDDRYGGELTDRMTFPLEIVEGICERVGDEFGLSVRLGADEFVEGGYGIEESTRVAQLLEAAGVDVINVTAGTYGAAPKTLEPMRYEEAWRAYLAAEIGDAVDIPTIAVGVIRQPSTAAQIIQDGTADFVAIGRGHIADPHFANKAKAGRVEEINRCIGCNIGCIGEGTFADKFMGCTVNPTVGREREFATLEPAATHQAVLVVGAGPAGIEAAIWGTERGHDITLYDKAETIGGQITLATVPPGKDKIGWFLEYLETELEKRPIDIRLGETVDADRVREVDPDAVVVATGARPRALDVPGADRDHVVQAWDILSDTVTVDDGTVVIIGGGAVGCDTAAYLADTGVNVTIIEQLDEIAPDMEKITRIDMIAEFEADTRISWETNQSVHSIEASSVVTVDSAGNESTYDADVVVLAVGHETNDELARALADDPVDVYVVGDARESRDIYRATGEGTEVGCSIGARDPSFSPRS